ncbi:MAG: hypothetical protein ACLTYW_02460 [Collinsella sp.]
MNLDYAASTPMRAEAPLRSVSTTTASLRRQPQLAALAWPQGRRTPGSRPSRDRPALARRVRPSEIVLTNGGTEANQLALRLAEGARQRDRKRPRDRSAIEHDSILDNLPLLRAAGFSVDLVQPPHGLH